MMDALEYVRPFYAEGHRKYHTLAHIQAMLDFAGPGIPPELYLAILFHDVVYDPYRKDSEERSSELFLAYAEENGVDVDRKKVAALILATKNHFRTFDDPDTKRLIDADLSIFLSTKAVLEYERGIFYEYQKYPVGEYVARRVEFLESAKRWFGEGTMQTTNCDLLIHYLRNTKFKIGIYAGSFNPYHVGHEDICTQAEQVFDKVILAQGYNRDKNPPPLISHRKREVIHYETMLTDLFEKDDHCEKTLIRGLRNSFDVGYEDSLRNTLQDIRDINVVYFFCQKRHEHISSSMIRSLYPFGEEVYRRYLL